MLKWIRRAKAAAAAKEKEKEEKKKKKPQQQNKDGNQVEEWYLRWEYEENPPQGLHGAIFSPCPNAGRIRFNASQDDSQPPEEVTLTQIMKYYKVFDGGKSLIGELGSCVTTKARLTEETYRGSGGERLQYFYDPDDGSIVVLGSDIRTTGQLQHPNVTRVYGWLEDRESHTFSVVHEPIREGSLYSHLHYPHLLGSDVLPWQHRYKVACGLAAAIHYLNEEYDFTCLHAEINSQNVFLDGDYNAKLLNLGAFKFEGDTSITAVVMGTSYCSTFKIKEPEGHSRKLNVRWLGDVLLEMACGLDPVTLKQLTVWQFAMVLYTKGELLAAIDPKLGDSFDREKMERLALVGLWCAQPEPDARPSIKQVIKYLSFEASLPPQLPSGTLLAFLKISKSLEESVSDVKAVRSAAAHAQAPVLGPASSSSRATPAYGKISTPPREETEPFRPIPRQDSFDDLSPVAVEPEIPDVDDPSPEVARDSSEDEEEAFDLGIPPNYRCSREPLKEYQLQLARSIVEGLKQSLEEELDFAATLDLTRKYTQALMSLGVPVKNWNALAQDVLRAAKLLDRFRKGGGQGEDPRTRDLSAIEEEMERCSRGIEESEMEQGMLVMKQVELQRQVLGIEKEIRGVEEEARRVERRKAEETRSLERHRKELEMLELVQTVVSRVSSFSCEA